jgi:hypothetical protein
VGALALVTWAAVVSLRLPDPTMPPPSKRGAAGVAAGFAPSLQAAALASARTVSEQRM